MTTRNGIKEPTIFKTQATKARPLARGSLPINTMPPGCHTVAGKANSKKVLFLKLDSIPVGWLSRLQFLLVRKNYHLVEEAL